MGSTDTLQQAEEPPEPPLCGSSSKGDSIAGNTHSEVEKPAAGDTERSRICRIAHTLSANQVADLLGTHPENGLTVDDAATRLENDGPNKVKGAEGLSLWKILLRQVSNSLTLVLTFTMALSFGINDYIEGGVIAAVITLNIVVGFVQDYHAEKKIMALYALSAPLAKVMRSGRLDTVKAETLVAGDIVHLSVGDVVPADIRLIDSMNLSTDEALLTGESLTISKKPHEIFSDPDMPIGDRRNMVYSASSVTQGRATGIVVATGMGTEVGKIAELLRHKKSTNEPKSKLRKLWDSFVGQVKTILGLVGTPLTVSLSKFALLLFGLAITLTIIVFSASKWDIADDVLIYGICVAVAVIPESLIAVLTITVAVGTKEMAKGNVIVRKLSSLEAVGGVTNICSDKTGTLTQGKMIARKAWIPGSGTLLVENAASPYDPTSGSVRLDGMDKPFPGDRSPLSNFLTAIAMCNLAKVFQHEDSTNENSDPAAGSQNQWKASGEPTEIALQVLAMRLGFGKSELLQGGSLELLAEYPFDSSTKRMTAVYRDMSTSNITGYVKGATEVVLNFVSASEERKAEIRSMAEKLAGEGLRVLSVAYRTFDASPALTFEPSDRAMVESNLNFLGLVGIYDPPRPESALAVSRCQMAGIMVHMLTGDHIRTATAIAHSVGILGSDTPNADHGTAIMSASDFDRLTDAEIDNMATLPLVLARCSPETKVRMVEAMHRRGAFCVMTGDGVNDSPALKRANVGIAMGLNGSDVAKEAADMVLTDDNFASIVRSVEEGRRLFDNIQKFLMHLLVSNIAQVILLLIGLAFKDSNGDAVFPLSPLEILWVNLITSSFLALGLGLEEAQHDIMTRPPHNLRVGVFTRELIVDKMIYGFFMGSLCLAAFTSVTYGYGGGQLGHGCNEDWNDTCGNVFRARATTYATLTLLLLVTAWEVKHFRRSLFRLDPVRYPGRFSIFPALWSNRFLFWAVTAGFVICFPIVYIPVINRIVFKHEGITWEWGVVFGCLVMYVALVESWKGIKRISGFGTVEKRLFGRRRDVESVAVRIQQNAEKGDSSLTVVPETVH